MYNSENMNKNISPISDTVAIELSTNIKEENKTVMNQNEEVNQENNFESNLSMLNVPNTGSELFDFNKKRHLSITKSGNEVEKKDLEKDKHPTLLYRLKHPLNGKLTEYLNSGTKSSRIAQCTIKTFSILTCLYFFFLGLKLLSESFKVLSGRKTGQLFGFASNPMAGLIVGMFGTVLLQSSSTSTSIVVGMVGSGALKPEHSIPIIMGSNIGTSVTNTFVSMAHINDLNEFQRAFAGATVHDFFNILSVSILLPTEIIVRKITGKRGLIEIIAYQLTRPLKNARDSSFTSPIKYILDPFANLFLKSDKKMIKLQSQFSSNKDEFFRHCFQAKTKNVQNVSKPVNYSSFPKCDPEKFTLVAKGMLKGTSLSDTSIAIIILVFALIFIIVSLIFLVKLLSIILKGRASYQIRRSLGFNPYLAMLMGAIITILVQSSSITTSTLIPLIALDAITLEQIFPLTLGANLGTTITAVLAATTSDKDHLQEAMQAALSHLFFNVLGILIQYPIPYFRSCPIECAKSLGQQAKRTRQASFIYMISVFLLIPGLFFGLTFDKSNIALICGLVIFVSIAIFCFVWRQIRVRCPYRIPLWCPKLFKPNERGLEEEEFKDDNINKNDKVLDETVGIEMKTIECQSLSENSVEKIDKGSEKYLE